ncbi:hypothetical protein M432DRAFT_621954 [Thermoascus aurantiacus ATCC 26904]
MPRTFSSPRTMSCTSAHVPMDGSDYPNGDKGMSCGLKWTEGGWDGGKGISEQMSAMEVFQSNLVAKVTLPVTNSTGGTSKGDYSAGQRSIPMKP